MEASLLRPLLLILSMVMAGPVFAGGYLLPSEQNTPVIVQHDWTGFYAGLQAEAGPGIEGELEFDALLAGVFAGYRYDLGAITLGAEVDVVTGRFEFGLIPVGLGSVDIGYDVTLLRLGGEVGYDLGRALPYVTAGVAQMETYLDLLDRSATDNGVFFGIGLDYRLNDQVVIGVEALHHEFTDFNGIADSSFTSFGVNVAFAF
jgi:opacity protein-like surface antigen